MGFLDNLFGKAVADSITKVIKDAVGNVNNTGSAAQPASTPAADSAPAGTAEPEYNDFEPSVRLNVKHREPFTPDASAIGSSCPDHGDSQYFADIINANMPEMEISQNVPLSSLSGDSPAKQMPVTLLLRRGGAPVLAILLVSKNRYRTYSVLNTLNSCEAAGIPAIRFMKEFRNDAGYVVGRIRAVAR